MIEHIVMWKFADRAEGRTREENMAWVREHLLALRAVIPQIRFMELGSDVSHTAMSYDMALLTRFDSLEDLKTYQVHPAHVAVSSYVKLVTTARVVLDAARDAQGELL